MTTVVTEETRPKVATRSGSRLSHFFRRCR